MAINYFINEMFSCLIICKTASKNLKKAFSYLFNQNPNLKTVIKILTELLLGGYFCPSMFVQ
jgi:hypothetical protein